MRAVQFPNAMPPAGNDDARFMAAALNYGRRHMGMAAPNPSVGAVIVRTGGEPVILARGVTAKGGRPHAETEALMLDASGPLVRAAGLDERNVQVLVINDPSINAFVAGGQIVWFHSGLIATAQVAAGVFVIVLVMIPMILFDSPTSIQVAEGLLLAFVAWMAYLAARQAEISQFRSWMYVLSVIVSVLIVLALKSAIGH